MNTKTKKILYAVGVVVLLIIISGLAEPIIIESERENWPATIEKKVTNIESALNDFIDTEFEKVLEEKKRLKSDLQKLLTNQPSASAIIDLLNQSENLDFNIQIYDNENKPVAWNRSTFAEDIFSEAEQYGLNELYFFNDKLITFLVLRDTLDTGNRYTLFFSKPVEKEFIFKNKYYNQISLSHKLSEKFETKFEIEFNPAAQYSADGRFSSIDIFNELNNKIGIIHFKKPTQTQHLNNIKEAVKSVQSVLFIIIYILLGFIIFLNIKSIKMRLMRLTVYLFYLTLLRVFLFVFNLPHKFISSDLTNPDFFDSRFGFGMTGSPIDFFISVIFILVICLVVYKYINEYSVSRRMQNKKAAAAAIISLTFLFLLLLRGFAASLNSVVFDSTLRYFGDVSLLPNAPIFLMEVNILLLGVCFVIISVSIIRFLLVISRQTNQKSLFGFFIFLFFFFQIAGVLFDLFQSQPQGTPFIRILYISIAFILAYYIHFNKTSLINFIYIAFAASILSISLLNYYNSELQRESLKSTALKLVRPSEPFLKYLISDTFREQIRSKTTLKAFTESTPDNYMESAFKIWTRSKLYDEGISCEINLLDSNKIYLGGYSVNFDEYYRSDWNKFNVPEQPVAIFTESLLFSDSKIVRGISPVKVKGQLKGYLEISVLYDVDTFEFRDLPDFLSGKRDIINPEMNYEDLAIFDFHDGELINELSDFTLTNEEVNKLLSVEFSKLSEAWLTTPLKSEMHRVYLVKSSQTNFERILAVALKERETTWNLYDFFKVFFIHSIVIVAGLILFIIWGLGSEKKLKLTFRTRLLMAFILVSIVPLILLASYFRLLTEEKNSAAQLYKLGKRAFNVEAYINDYIANSSINSIEIFDKANRDLGINFSIFRNQNLIYSTTNKYYQIGLLPETINPVAYKELIYNGAKEFVVEENIENYKFSTFYYRGIIGSDEYIYKVSELFNPIQLPLSDIEISIFLFGSYSLAIILIVVLSTILANQISSPIRKLTSATKSVASGDLNIRLSNNSRGEMGQLVQGFNLMVRELNRSQAELAEIERETAWKEFARQVAHEIKNPLTPMKLSVQQLSAAHKDQSPKFNSIFEKVTETLINQIETLKNIATEFSSFARMPKVNVAEMNLNSALLNAVNLFTEENVKIKLNGTLKDEIILADVDQVTRTFINLFRNSIQAGADKINCSLFEEEKFIQIRIEDNGHGIPENLREKVFENNFTTKREGMGIGLSLAKKYLENIHGSVVIENSSEAGTSILLSFPKVNK